MYRRQEFTNDRYLAAKNYSQLAGIGSKVRIRD